MTEKISPIGFSFNTNRYSKSDLLPKTQKQRTVVLDGEKFNYGDIFERRHYEPATLYSWEKRGRVKGLFEGKSRDSFVSLTRTIDGGMFEKIKKGDISMIAEYTKDGKLINLIEETPNKVTFIDRVGKLSEATGMAAKTKLQNIIKGIKIV